MNEYTKHLSEPWFTLVKTELKTIEGRLAKGDFQKLQPDDEITFINHDYGLERSVKCNIAGITRFNTFRDLLESNLLKQCLPGIETVDDGVTIYRQFYTPDDEETYKVLAIELKVLDN